MTKPYFHEAFDMGVLRQDASTKVGLMLRRGRGEVPAWAVYDDEFLAAQYFTGDPGYGNLPPEKELAIRQDDWRSGLGLEVYDANDPKRYHKSTMDMRFRGMGIAGWKSTAIALTALSATTKITNYNMETAASGWTGGERSSTQKHGGTYSWRSVMAVGTSTQECTSVNDDWEYTLSAWVYASEASKARISLVETGGDTVYSGYHTGTPGWEELTTTILHSSTPAGAITAVLRLESGATIPAYFDDVVPGGGTLALANGTMEADANWTGGVRSSEQAHGGTYSWKVGYTTAINCYQDITLNLYTTEPSFTFAAWVYASDASAARIGINDGVATTYSSYHTGTPGWEQLTVTRTLNVAADKLRLEMRRETSGIALAYFDDATLTHNPSATIVDMSEFNDALYYAIGKTLAKLNATGDGLTFINVFPATLTRLEVMQISGTDYLFITLGLSDQYWYMVAAETFTESAAAVTDFKYFCLVNAAAPVMWGSDGVNTIRSTVNPLNGGTAWSAQTTVDTTYYEITGLKTDGASLYVMKENRPYYLNSAGAVQSDLAPELDAMTHSTDNGKNAAFWYGNLYMPWGDQSLLEYDSGTNTWRSPALFATNAAEYNGQVFAVYGDDQYLYAILDYSTKIEVLAGRLETIDGTTSWIWHCINETTLTGCETAFISTIYQKRLWISSTSSSDNLYYIPLPLGYADVANDTNRSFQTGTTMETPWLHGNFKATAKAFPELELVMGHTYNANRYFTVAYKKLGDSSWTTIGNYTGSATSMTQSKYIPVDASSNNPKSTMFKLLFTAVTNDTTVTPILNNYYLKGVLYPDRRKIIVAKVYCANEIQLGDGTIDKGSYDTIVTTLEEARDATWPVTIYDIDGSTKTVKFLPLPSNVPWYRVIASEKERKLEIEFNLFMQMVDLS